jgi:adenylylsulfate kinase
MVIWLIGLSGAGKTVIGKELFTAIKKEQSNTVFLDGDLIREVMGEDLGHTIEDRRKNADRICRLCRMLDRQNINVVCAILSLFHESHEWNRRKYSSYFEIFIKVSQDILIKRNQKGLYEGALAGTIKNVVGVDIPFEPPRNPDLIIENDLDREDFKGVINEIMLSISPFK